MDNRNRIDTLNVILLLLLLLPVFVFGQELLKMPEPTRTVVGVPCAKLTVVKEIESDFDEDLFFAAPYKISVGKRDDEGRFYFYVYDYKLINIYVFNDKFKCINQFLEQGLGPGEVFPGNAGSKDLYAAPDGNLYVSDSFSNKIIQFSTIGKHIKDIKLPLDLKAFRPYTPVVDKDGFYYTYSTRGGIVTKLNSKMKIVYSFLDLKYNDQYVVFKPALGSNDKNYRNKLRLTPNPTNVMYGITADGQLLIYFFRSSKVLIFNGEKQVREFNVLIDRVLPVYRKRAEDTYKRQKSNNHSIIYEALMFGSCIVDQDEPYFYLNFLAENKTCSLYKFDLEGKLVQIIENINAGMRAKRHGLFFGLAPGDRHPVIFKQEDLK